MDSALSGLEKRLSITEKSKLDSDDLVVKLTNELKIMLETHPKKETEMSQQMSEAEAESQSLFDELQKSASNLEYMKTHTNEMETSMQEMAIAKTNMLNTIQQLNADIQGLE